MSASRTPLKHVFRKIFCLVNSQNDSSKLLFNVGFLFQRNNHHNHTGNQKKSHLTTMKLETPEFKSIFTPELTKLHDIFKRHGYELRVAGGAVRDLLMGKRPEDLDFATTATPEEMKKIFTEENVRLINNKGEKHGTITPRIDDKVNFEMENTRLDGTVYDYFNGVEDLRKRRITFVGDARQRIQEDYLRILRYFRFFGRIANEGTTHEKTTLVAIRENASGLDRISGERIWAEMKKILTGNHASEMLELMVDLGITPHIGLPARVQVDELRRVSRRAQENGWNLHAVTLLVSLLASEEEMLELNKRLKISAFDRDLGLFLVLHRYQILPDEQRPLRPYQYMLVDAKRIKDHHAWICGKSMTRVINELKDLWKESDFKMTQEELENHIPEIVERIGIQPRAS
ncbi:unnamed protein product [Darwinula stevensoni]|uniref:Uncharacterized protein n=1 Tax=Darwinula stevensoni TaxID=69355 RepID=A0A7R9A6G7_9CRUS|nr:unnamed protein product [Darwinula stevensoni]CAG0889118.1 unnamed protein product [Darwinula stevensoni]